MCWQSDPFLARSHVSPEWLREVHDGIAGLEHRTFDHHYVIVAGRGWGKSVSPSALNWPFEPTEYFSNFTSDDRPIGEIVEEHFRARFERIERALSVFQNLYSVLGASPR